MEEDVIIVYLADFEFAGSETYDGKRFYAYRDVLFDFISERDLRWFWGRLDLREGALRDNSVILLSHIFSDVSLRRGFYYRLHVKGLLSMQRRPEYDPESPNAAMPSVIPNRLRVNNVGQASDVLNCEARYLTSDNNKHILVVPHHEGGYNRFGKKKQSVYKRYESPRLGCATYHPGRAPFLRWCIR